MDQHLRRRWSHWHLDTSGETLSCFGLFVGMGTPSVQYAYDDAATSNVFTSSLRLKMVTYPNGRKVHSTYGSGGSVADVLDRVDLLEEDSGGSPGTDLVQYSYNGTNRHIITDYPQPDFNLNLYLFWMYTGVYWGHTRGQARSRYSAPRGFRNVPRASPLLQQTVTPN